MPFASAWRMMPSLFSQSEESRNIKVAEDANGNLVYDCSGEVLGPVATLQGTLNPDGTGNPLLRSDNITENPALNSTEEWTLFNLAIDAHPIHVHLVKFQIVDWQQLATDGEGITVWLVTLLPGTIRAPEARESSWKDTVIAYPGEVTRIRGKFDLLGFPSGTAASSSMRTMTGYARTVSARCP